MYYSDIEEHVESLERELDEVLREVSELRHVSDELERQRNDLENQIHEDGGFIDRIVELEAMNAQLGTDYIDTDNRLGQIIRWLEDNDHMLSDGGDALWEIIYKENSVE
jgi:predicted RNase H-like nuclease (RuvC/YqgF family)